MKMNVIDQIFILSWDELNLLDLHHKIPTPPKK